MNDIIKQNNMLIRKQHHWLIKINESILNKWTYIKPINNGMATKIIKQGIKQKVRNKTWKLNLIWF